MRRLFASVVLSLALVVLCSPVYGQSVTPPTFKALQKIQKLVEAEQHLEAQNLLETLVTQTRDRPYDYAIVNQYLAHTSIVLNQPKRARIALANALSIGELPPEIRTELNLFYGTVLMGEEEFSLAKKVLEEWLAAEQFPKPRQIFSVAYANYKSGDLVRAEPLLAQAIEAQENPPESWYQLYYRVLFDLRKHTRAKNVLHQMITREPSNHQLWRLLANHHLQLDHSGEALAAVMLAYFNDLITDPDELEQLVSMLNFIDVPDKGARLMQQWLDDGRLETNAKNIRQLGNLWLMARERDQAKVVLKKSASIAPDGRTYELLAGVYFEDEQWPEAYRAYQNAIRIGNLKEPQRIYLLAGISAFRAGLKDEAEAALKIAAQSVKFRAQAEGLIKMLDKQRRNSVRPTR